MNNGHICTYCTLSKPYSPQLTCNTWPFLINCSAHFLKGPCAHVSVWSSSLPVVWRDDSVHLSTVLTDVMNPIIIHFPQCVGKGTSCIYNTFGFDIKLLAYERKQHPSLKPIHLLQLTCWIINLSANSSTVMDWLSGNGGRVWKAL